MSAADLEQLARRFFGAYGAGELETMRELLASDAVSWITNAEGDADRVEGREGVAGTASASALGSLDDHLGVDVGRGRPRTATG